MRVLNGLTAGHADRSEERGRHDRGSDLGANELSPSLLAIEAELRGAGMQPGEAEGLQREIYQALAQTRPPTGPEEPR